MVTGPGRAGAGAWGGTENTGMAAAGTTGGDTGPGGPGRAVAALGGCAGTAWADGDGVRGGE